MRVATSSSTRQNYALKSMDAVRAKLAIAGVTLSV